jgi:drug/metabolite transporter (DMT)-like permease
MPLFGTVLALLFLHEKLQLYHLGGVVMIAAGILLASVKGRRARDDASAAGDVIASAHSSS